MKRAYGRAGTVYGSKKRSFSTPAGAERTFDELVAEQPSPSTSATTTTTTASSISDYEAIPSQALPLSRPGRTPTTTATPTRRRLTPSRAPAPAVATDKTPSGPAPHTRKAPLPRSRLKRGRLSRGGGGSSDGGSRAQAATSATPPTTTPGRSAPVAASLAPRTSSTSGNSGGGGGRATGSVTQSGKRRRRFLLRPSRSNPASPAVAEQPEATSSTSSTPRITTAATSTSELQRTFTPTDSQLTELCDEDGDGDGGIDTKSITSLLGSPDLNRSQSLPVASVRKRARVTYGSGMAFGGSPAVRSSLSVDTMLRRSVSSPQRSPTRPSAAAAQAHWASPAGSRLPAAGPARQLSRTSSNGSADSVALADTQQVFVSRESGRNQQVLDDVQYQLEGLGPEAAPATRAQCLLALAKHYGERSVRRLMRAHGFTTRILSKLDGVESHKLLALSAGLFLHTLSSDKPQGDVAGRIIDVLCAISRSRLGPSADKRLGKMSRTILSRIRSICPEDAACDMEKPQALAWVCFDALAASKQPDMRFLFREKGVLDHLVMQVQKRVPELLASLPATQGGTDEDGDLSWSELLLCLKIIRSSLFEDKENQHFVGWFEGSSIVRSIGQLLPACFSVFNDRGCPQSIQDVSCASLRVLLSLTHNHESVCGKIEETGLLSAIAGFMFSLPAPGCEDPSATISLGLLHDLWVLCLSLLTNVVEHNAECRLSLGLLLVSSSGSPPESPRPFLNAVVDLFAGLIKEGQQRQQEAETSDNIVAAYCCLLIGCLVKECPENVERLLSVVNADLLSEIILHVQEFVLWQRTHIGSEADMTSMERVIDTLQGLEGRCTES